MEDKYRIQHSANNWAIAERHIATDKAKKMKVGEEYWQEFSWHGNIGQALRALQDIHIKENIQSPVDLVELRNQIKKSQDFVMQVPVLEA